MRQKRHPLLDFESLNDAMYAERQGENNRFMLAPSTGEQQTVNSEQSEVGDPSVNAPRKATQHHLNLHQISFERLESRLVKIPEPRGDFKLRVDFTERRLRYVKKMEFVLAGFARQSFGDIGWDGNRSSSQLCRQAEILIPWERLRDLEDPGNAINGPLPDFEFLIALDLSSQFVVLR